MKKKIGIIGGGASGLICALVASAGECEVTVIEKNSRVGRKILATGNGRCNITNKSITWQHYHGHHPSFVSTALKQFGYRELERFFAELGLDFVSVEDGRVFPMSLQASSVVDFLEDACLRSGVGLKTKTAVSHLEKRGERFVLFHEAGKMEFDIVVVATGSAAMPTLGSSDSGLQFARKFGHHIYPSFPVLVQLQSNDPFCQKCSGVKTDAMLTAIVEGETKKSLRGDLLFTNYGLSGLAVLDISRVVSAAREAEKESLIEIDLLPDISLNALKKILQNKSKRFSEKPPMLWLNGILHKKIVQALLESLKLQHKAILGTKDLHKVAFAIKHLQIRIDQTRGAKGAEVMAGGVDCSEVDAKTMESKLVKNLFFTGELLDIDGERGGYNLHWAWASGYLAGKSSLVLTNSS
jgi:predicted Rossmann fold flavoprotein